MGGLADHLEADDEAERICGAGKQEPAGALAFGRRREPIRHAHSMERNRSRSGRACEAEVAPSTGCEAGSVHGQRAVLAREDHAVWEAVSQIDARHARRSGAAPATARLA